MSWTATAVPVTKENAISELQEAFDRSVFEPSSAVVAQFEKAVGAIKLLIEESAVRGDTFRAQCYGHVKEGVESSTDSVTVSLSTL